jgi:nicotinate-nucleotide--dimethylbenzimidazole phosphoribosyltransferase
MSPGERVLLQFPELDPIVAVSATAHADALAHHDRLTKPRGALGRLESLGAQLSAISALVPPPVPQHPAIAVFAADHGVLREGVSPWPQEVTAQMVANFTAGGAAINVLARQAGATVAVVDVGVVGDLDAAPTLRLCKVRPGTDNLRVAPAMTHDDAIATIRVGILIGQELLAAGADLLVGGDMGIGNTTSSAAVIAALTGTPAERVTGRGTGIDDAMLGHKIVVIRDALHRMQTAHPDDAGDPLVVLTEVGGLEIGALAGFYLAAAAARIPVIVDGVIALAGACLAHAFEPLVADYLVAGHRSTEPAAQVALVWLELDPLVDLSMRLGEGSGAALAVPIVQAAAAIMRDMATFDSAGVSDKAG